jgi:hypothetical protein
VATQDWLGPFADERFAHLLELERRTNGGRVNGGARIGGDGRASGGATR